MSTLRLLSYNIQAGLSTNRYSDYVTRSWKHVVPVPSRMANLDNIAQIVTGYDVVGLQEVDSGSLRSGFVNQGKYLADLGGFSYLYNQSNRRIGIISQHSNTVLSRRRPQEVEALKLPGLIPGRGVLRVGYGHAPEMLHVFVLHMALGQRGRLQQIHYLSSLIHQRNYRHVVVMGDLNCRSDSRELKLLLREVKLREPLPGLHTFPSWQPNRQLDHILVSQTLEVVHATVLPHAFSDHLPIAMELQLPKSLRLE